MYSRFFCSCRSSTTGPISVPALSASSTTNFLRRSTTAWTNRSWMPSVTMIRLDAVHRWPDWKYAPFTATDTAVGRSASSSTMRGFLPPISSCTRAPFFTAAAATPGPTSRDPVKLIASIPATEASAAPSFAPGPMTRLSTPVGSPARWTMSASAHGDAGTSSAGLKITQFPNASAGAIFHAGIANGKFHGVIRPTTPTASRVTSTSMPGRTESSLSPAASAPLRRST